MKKVFLFMLVSMFIQSCASSPTTPEEQDELQQRHERLHELRDFRV